MTNPKHTDTSRSGDLVERLRDFTCINCGHDYFIHDEAADRIEALEAENERLRNTITRLKGYAEHQLLCPGDFEEPCTCGLSALLEEIDRD